MAKKILALIIPALLLVISCAKKDYTELKGVMIDIVAIYEKFHNDIEKNTGKKERIKIMNGFSDEISMKFSMKKTLLEKHPDLDNKKDWPDDIMELWKKICAEKNKLYAIMGELTGKYKKDADFKKANSAMWNKLMMNR
jgi:hypothetical protein